MATKAAAKVKRAALPTPQDRDEVSDAIHRIGEAQRAVERLQAEMNDQIAAIKSEYELRAQPFNDEIRLLADGVHAFCEAHRDELTEGGKVKYAKFAAGEVAWRLNPPKVVTRRGIGLETILELLRGRGLARFIRTKEELNKEAILLEPETVAGMKELSIEQSEQFAIKPFESEIEAVV